MGSATSKMKLFIMQKTWHVLLASHDWCLREGREAKGTGWWRRTAGRGRESEKVKNDFRYWPFYPSDKNVPLNLTEISYLTNYLNRTIVNKWTVQIFFWSISEFAFTFSKFFIVWGLNILLIYIFVWNYIWYINDLFSTLLKIKNL